MKYISMLETIKKRLKILLLIAAFAWATLCMIVGMIDIIIKIYDAIKGL